MKPIKLLLLTVLELVPLALLLLVLHVIGTDWRVQLGTVIGFLLLRTLVTVQVHKTTRSADLAAALARGTGTYIVGGVDTKNLKPATERLGIQLGGVQPGAVPRDVITGDPIILTREHDAAL